MRPIALGRKNYLFMGSERGGKSAAITYTLIETAKLNGVDPQAWLTNVLGRIADHKITKLERSRVKVQAIKDASRRTQANRPRPRPSRGHVWLRPQAGRYRLWGGV